MNSSDFVRQSAVYTVYYHGDGFGGPYIGSRTFMRKETFLDALPELDVIDCFKVKFVDGYWEGIELLRPGWDYPEKSTPVSRFLEQQRLKT